MYLHALGVRSTGTTLLIDSIIEAAPKALVSWQDAMAPVPTDQRSPLEEWMRAFDLGLDPEGSPSLYAKAGCGRD